MTNVKVTRPQAAHCLPQEPFVPLESDMTIAASADTSPFAEITAIAMGLAAMCIGTVALIGGTGLMMWVFGL